MKASEVIDSFTAKRFIGKSKSLKKGWLGCYNKWKYALKHGTRPAQEDCSMCFVMMNRTSATEGICNKCPVRKPCNRVMGRQGAKYAVQWLEDNAGNMHKLNKEQ